VGACYKLAMHAKHPEIFTDVEHNIPTLRHSLFLLYLFQNLTRLINDLLDDKINYQVATELRKANFGHNFEWMRVFFADHRRLFVEEQHKFSFKFVTETDTASFHIWHSTRNTRRRTKRGISTTDRTNEPEQTGTGCRLGLSLFGRCLQTRT